MIRGVTTALYGWMERFARDGVEWDWESLYGACAESGVDAVETDPEPHKLAVARSVGLAVSSSYVGLPLHLPWDALDTDRAVLPVAERLAAAGGSELILNADQADWDHPAAKSVDGARRQGENLTRIAGLVAPLGLRVSLHNHAHTFDEAQLDLDSVLTHADPAVGLCVDTGWAWFAGHDPLAWVREHPQRVFAFHFRNMRGQVPTEDLSEGDLDVPAIVRTAVASGYDGWLGLELWHPAELQPERSMVEDVRRSAALLREAAANAN
ncbi:sugar phosphate isomerase/epimerase family protein [Leifsonia xyli]|uniref:sugar phosphate isomerase/epimerase family protein n=1 Tax=Leifsonia xyli TaxID=1575 RepID=UPI003D673B9D